MGRRARIIGLLTAFVLASVAVAAATSASAAVAWNLDIHHNQTNFPAGGTGQYWFDVANVGGTDTSGTITLVVNLPSGLMRNSVTVVPGPFLDDADLNWSCPGTAGATKIT